MTLSLLTHDHAMALEVKILIQKTQFCESLYIFVYDA
jgi:hypothetical protein